MKAPHFFDELQRFEALKLRARLALKGAEVFYKGLNEAHWPDKHLSLKKEIGVWQLPWLAESLNELEKCQSERGLFNISAQLFQYQRDMFRVWELIKPFFEYSEDYGVYILKKSFSWFPFHIRPEVEEHNLMSVAADITDRVKNLLDATDERREFKIREIEAAAKRAGYQGTLRQLRRNLVKWHGGEREEVEWLLSGSQLDDFLNHHLLPKQRQRKKKRHPNATLAIKG